MSEASTRSKTEKSARLEVRVTPEQKAFFQKAATLLGSSLTDFVVRSAHDRARRAVREHEMLVLSTRDSRAFVDALLDAKEPGQRLRNAARNYRKSARR